MEVALVELDSDAAAGVAEDVIQRMIYVTCIVHERPHCVGCIHQWYQDDMHRQAMFLKHYEHLMKTNFGRFMSELAKDVRAFVEDHMQEPCANGSLKDVVEQAQQAVALAQCEVAGSC